MQDLRDYLKPGRTFSPAAFRDPPSCFAVQYAWVWYAPITRQEIRRQIEIMHQAGIRGFYVLPEPREFRPATMITEMEPPYLTEAFFELSRYAAETAAELGMTCWLYDEGGWPSGGACGQVIRQVPGTERKVLQERKRPWPAGTPYAPSQGTLAAYVGKARITAGTVFAAETEIREVTVEIISHHYVDIYDPRAAAKFVELTHDGYIRAFGDVLKTVPLMFTDEPSGSPDAWSEDLPRLFREKYGYDLLDWLYVITDPEELSEEEYRVRLDYVKLQAERFAATMKTFGEACHRGGMLFGGHLDNDNKALGCVTNGYRNTLAGLKMLDVPGVDVIWGQIMSDGKTTEGSSFFPRLAASAAAQRGTNLALSESFAVYGNALTADEYRYILNYQLVRGINLFNIMNLPNSVQGAYGFRERPTWHSELPGFFHLAALNTEIARSGYFMSHGVPAPKAALLYPHDDFYRGRAAARQTADAYDRLGLDLERRGIDFDVIDPETLQTGEVRDGALHCGLGVYPRVFVPEGAAVPEEAARKIGLLSGEMPGWLTLSGEQLLQRTRLGPDGERFHCIFNQSPRAQWVTVSAADGMPLVRFDPRDGSVTALADGSPLWMPSGSCLLLYGGAPVATDEVPCWGAPVTLTCDGVTLVRRALADQTGIRAVPCRVYAAPAESFREMFGEGISGEAEYHFTFTLAAPEDALLAFAGLEDSAMVAVNGRPVGFVATTPHRLRIPKDALRAGSNEMVVTVANLAADLFGRARTEEWFPPEWLGPYDKISKGFERKAMGRGGLFGPITLCLRK